MIENFNEIQVVSPADKIIRQIKDLITSGQLNPGDKLPPERKLSERLGVGRMHVRDAIKKLEFYGILRTHPQSGTVVAGLGITALEGLISDVLDLDNADFSSLVETRVILELNITELAAERRTADDIIAIEKALDAYTKKVKEGKPAIEEDLMFHLKIAEASKNSVLKSLMLIITPDIVNNYVNLKVCDNGSFDKTIKEHEIILQHIVNQKPKKAREAMNLHLHDVLEFSIQDK